MERQIKTVLTTVNYEGWHWDKLAAALAPANIIRADKNDTKAISEALKEADAAILGGDISDQILNEGKNLKWIHCDHAGLNFSARPEIFQRGIMLTGSAGRSGPVLAEHTFFLVLSLIYKIHELSAQQKAHIWGGRMYVESRGLYSKTMGIIGMGFTGREVAKRAKVFGMNVLGYDRNCGEIPEGVDEMFCADKGERVDELLRRSDILVLSVRLSDETYHMIDGRAFEMMKPTSLLINMARGSVVDEAALAAALQTGQIGGAGCDTFEYEPLDSDSPLWDLPNMVITPHCTPEMPDLVAQSLEIICDNINRYREGRPMRNQLAKRDVYTKTRPKE